MRGMGNSRESMGEDGNKDNKRDVRDQGDTCHDPAAGTPGSSIVLDLWVVKCNGLLDVASSHTPCLGDSPHRGNPPERENNKTEKE